MKIPSFEEFEKAVKKHYQSLVGDDDNARAYWDSDEAKEVVRIAYKNGAEDVRNGLIDEKIFLQGVANSAAYCLHLMY